MNLQRGCDCGADIKLYSRAQTKTDGCFLKYPNNQCSYGSINISIQEVRMIYADLRMRILNYFHNLPEALLGGIDEHSGQRRNVYADESLVTHLDGEQIWVFGIFELHMDAE